MFKSVMRWNLFGLGTGAVLWMVLGLLAAAPLPAEAQAPDARKMNREMRMMENVLDHVMVDSRNVLVGSRHSVNGVYLSGFGALFTVEAQLLLRDRHFFSGWHWSKWNDDDDDDRGRRRNRDDEDDDDSDDRWRERSRRNEERLYTDAKEELSEALLDYGDELTQLKASDWAAVCVYLDESARIGDKRISRLTIKARVSDLRDYAAKKLSRDAAMAKLVIDEY